MNPRTSNKVFLYQSLEVGSLLALVILSISWVIISGKDLSWDDLNYHLYSPYSLLNDRLESDFFAASIQGYLNPIGYIPFYLMVVAGVPSLWVALVLTAIHVANIALVYRFSKLVLSRSGAATPYPWMAVLIAFSTSLYWSLIGSTFLDLLVTVPMLLSICLLLENRDSLRVSSGGALMGAAVGLKLSCVVFALPAAGLLLFRPLSTRGVLLRRAGHYLLGLAMGFLLLYGYWGYQLWLEFGSPFFPFFNGLFQSEFFLSENISIQRYIPESLAAYLAFPFQVALPKYWIYSELINPDLKLVAVWFIVLVACFVWIAGRMTQRSSKHFAPSREFWVLLLFWCGSYVLWVSTSSAGRYGVLLFFVAGPLIVLGLRQLFPRHVLAIGLMLLSIQYGMLWAAGIPRWGERSPWSADWYNFDVPAELAHEPTLYLSAGANSLSFLAPRLHPGSSFANVSGQYPLSLDGPGAVRFKNIIEKYQLTRSLLPIQETLPWSRLKHPSILRRYIAKQNSVYGRFGYRATDDCILIRQKEHGEGGKQILTCRLERDSGAASEYIAEKSRIEPVVAILEWACGTRLRPVGGALEKTDFGWQKFYINTDTTLVITNGELSLRTSRRMNPLYMGTTDEIMRAGEGYSRSCDGAQANSVFHEPERGQTNVE